MSDMKDTNGTTDTSDTCEWAVSLPLLLHCF